ncbi:hypothetical protein FQA39_LY07458 [Lamprigera yunnana]|nr:hypothetical protein FQA39_LY07458 [Lamprigera yunnana]
MKKGEQEQIIRKTIKIDSFLTSGSKSSVVRPGTSTTCTDTIQSKKNETDLNTVAQQQLSLLEQSAFEKTDNYVFANEAVEESSISITIEDASPNQMSSTSNDQVLTTETPSTSFDTLSNSVALGVIAKHLAKLTTTFYELAKNQRVILDSLSPQQAASFDFANGDVKLPCASAEEVSHLNSWILESEEHERQLELAIKFIGGKNLRSTVYRILVKKFSNEITTQYNWTGKFQKIPLKPLKITHVIIMDSVATSCIQLAKERIIKYSGIKYNINDFKTGNCETMLLNQRIYYLNKYKSKWISVGLYYQFEFASVVKIFGRSKQYVIFKEEEWIQFREQRENMNKYFQTCDMMWKPRPIGSKTLTFEMTEENKILRIKDVCGNEVYLGWESVLEVWAVAEMSGDVKINIYNIVNRLSEKSDAVCFFLDFFLFMPEKALFDVQLERHIQEQEIQFINKMWMLYAEQHSTKAIDLKSAVERLFEKLGALEFDADHEAIYGMEKYYTVEQCEKLQDKYKIGRKVCNIRLQHFLDTIRKYIKDCSDSDTSSYSSDEEECKEAVEQNGEDSKTTEEEESKKSEGGRNTKPFS